MATYVLTPEDIALRNVMAYLKGRIVGYSVRKGMKWHSSRKPSIAFQMGYDKGVKKPERDFSWNQDVFKAEITSIHIRYNRLRHDRPHTGGVESDDRSLGKTTKSFERLLQDDVQIASLIGERSVEEEAEVIV